MPCVQIDDGSGSISLEEFGQSAAKLDLPIGRVSRARVRGCLVPLSRDRVLPA